jgi:hypothetical protein
LAQVLIGDQQSQLSHLAVSTGSFSTEYTVIRPSGLWFEKPSLHLHELQLPIRVGNLSVYLTRIWTVHRYEVIDYQRENSMCRVGGCR